MLNSDLNVANLEAQETSWLETVSHSLQFDAYVFASSFEWGVLCLYHFYVSICLEHMSKLCVCACVFDCVKYVRFNVFTSLTAIN